MSINNGTINTPKNTIIDGHEYVDLGLSVMWATCNVGAITAYDSGDYFAWGETTAKPIYSDRNCTTMDKKIGYIAGDAKYDAATANWGEPWRMPTIKEFEKLINEFKWKWMSTGVFDGYVITGSNGSHIFLPATGYFCGVEKSPYEKGKRGEYWSSTPCGNLIQSACSLLFFDDCNPFTTHNSRWEGRCIRPVIDNEQMKQLIKQQNVI